MTQQEKQLLLVDLCVRLPYVVICNCVDPKFSGSVDWTLFKINLQDCTIETTNNEWNDEFAIENIKPYLRPLSSMTEEEKREFQSFYPGYFGSQWLDVEKGEIEIFECSSTIKFRLNDSVEIVD